MKNIEELSQFQEIISWIDDFISAHSYLGWGIAIVLLLLWLYKIISPLFPAIKYAKSKVLFPLAKKVQNNWLAKQAIDAQITGKVNVAVQALKNELPGEWVKPLEIIWLEREDERKFLKDNKIVLRLRPIKDQQRNFVVAVYYFFRESLFPETERVIPEITKETVTLQLSQRVIGTENKQLNECFEDCVLEPIVKKRDKVLDYLERFKLIDNKGFFTGTFIREIDKVGREVKFKPERKKMAGEAVAILKHIEEFIKVIRSKVKSTSDEPWFRVGPVTTYAFLLVANSYKTRGGVQPYVNRARKNLEAGAKRLYVYGRRDQREFANKVIKEIDKNIPNCKLVEEFVSYKDYRGKKGGMGALFEAIE